MLTFIAGFIVGLAIGIIAGALNSIGKISDLEIIIFSLVAENRQLEEQVQSLLNGNENKKQLEG